MVGEGAGVVGAWVKEGVGEGFCGFSNEMERFCFLIRIKFKTRETIRSRASMTTAGFKNIVFELWVV